MARKPTIPPAGTPRASDAAVLVATASSAQEGAQGTTSAQPDSGIAQSTQPTSSFAINLPRQAVTAAEESLYHLVTDDQLTMLDYSQRDPVVEILFTAIGAAIGSLAPAGQAIFALKEGQPFTMFDLLQCAIFAVALVVAGLMAVFWFRRGQASRGLVGKIRNQTKQRQQGNDNVT